MKTKLMVLALMAGGSMFAATRFSVGVNVGAVAPACAPPVYNSYVAPAYGYVAPRYEVRDHRDFDRNRGHDRDDRGRARVNARVYSNDFHRR